MSPSVPVSTMVSVSAASCLRRRLRTALTREFVCFAPDGTSTPIRMVPVVNDGAVASLVACAGALHQSGACRGLTSRCAGWIHTQSPVADTMVRMGFSARKSLAVELQRERDGDRKSWIVSRSRCDRRASRPDCEARVAHQQAEATKSCRALLNSEPLRCVGRAGCGSMTA